VKTDLSPLEVAARLERLRQLYVPESEAEARQRMEDLAGLTRERSFSEAVARRLAELRALCELTDWLHTAGRPRETTDR
jgi:hypothetical protein